MGLDVEIRPIRVEELAEMDEVNSCGTAVVITPINCIDDKPALECPDVSRRYRIPSGENCGATSRKLYEHLTSAPEPSDRA